MAVTELDYMEYANDAAAQSAYVSSDADVYTKLLLHFNGSDGSTTFTDETGTHTVTAEGDAQLDTADKKFGTASLLLDGTGDYGTIPGHSDFDFGTGDFTIEVWAKSRETNENYIFSAQFSNENYRLYMYTPDDTNYYPAFIASSAESGLSVSMISATAMTQDNWVHYAAVRNGNSFKFYVGGVEKGSDTDSNAMPIVSGGLVNIGQVWGGSVARWDGWIDELRVSKGIARWTANFTPPSSEYVYSNNLQVYSESTIKQQGSYSLKAIAVQTDSLNDTLTRTI